MSTFKDIMDTIGGLEGEVTQFIINGKKHKSLSKSAMEGIMNFPVLVSDSLSIEDASLVSKACEREFASFTLTVMTMNPYLHTSGGEPSAAKYVRQFHQNIDTKADITDVINMVNNIVDEAATKLDVDYEVLSEEVAPHIIYHVYEGVNCSSINKENMKFNYSVSEIANPAILNRMANRSITEATTNNSGDRYNVRRGDVINNTNITMHGKNDPSHGGNSKVHGNKDIKFMMDNDVKKANELVPTLIHVRIFPVDKNSSTELEPIDFVLGVKATLHPISSDEIIVNIARGIKNENTFFNFLRWTTGEIKFVKDFCLSMNELKLDAINSSNKASRWWTTLKRRKALSRIKNVILPGNLLPNATIIITQDEADILRDQYGYNLTNTGLVDKLMKNYFLIAFIIVDPALQRVRFMFDGRTEFETLTYATLARESNANDKQFKEMLNMLGRRI